MAIAKHDTSQLLIMTELGGQHRNSNADSAFNYGKKVLDLAKRIKFLKGELKSIYQMSFAHRQMRNYTRIIKPIQSGLQKPLSFEYNLNFLPMSTTVHPLSVFGQRVYP